MPPPDTMYCAQQINIPPELPDILKQFTKAAIRTQPDDVLKWSAAYFSALSKNEPLPVKGRLETSPSTATKQTGLTPALLKVLHQQSLNRAELQMKWKGLSLPSDELDSLLSLGNFSDVIDWMQFFALGCSLLGGSIKSALKCACEILTDEPEDSSAHIPFDIFVSLYTYLARLDGDIPQDQIDSFIQNLQEDAARSGGRVQPSDFTGLPGENAE
ncbi:ropporin-1-like protein isoform X2 [Clupea harengus]|uniref:Ropporin-1-like protein n=1 Tax=Clupea harengus TaxID=7950 RepID=A0A6P8GJN1_CLUHA|nr:ropporin-1-like protein isoform X2 [Clupea harengus]